MTSGTLVRVEGLLCVTSATARKATLVHGAPFVALCGHFDIAALCLRPLVCCEAIGRRWPHDQVFRRRRGSCALWRSSGEGRRYALHTTQNKGHRMLSISRPPALWTRARDEQARQAKEPEDSASTNPNESAIKCRICTKANATDGPSPATPSLGFNYCFESRTGGCNVPLSQYLRR